MDNQAKLVFVHQNVHFTIDIFVFLPLNPAVSAIEHAEKVTFFISFILSYLSLSTFFIRKMSFFHNISGAKIQKKFCIK